MQNNNQHLYEDMILIDDDDDDWMFAFAMFMSLCVDVVCVGRHFYWCLWCWSVEECG